MFEVDRTCDEFEQILRPLTARRARLLNHLQHLAETNAVSGFDTELWQVNQLYAELDYLHSRIEAVVAHRYIKPARATVLPW